MRWWVLLALVCCACASTGRNVSVSGCGVSAGPESHPHSPEANFYEEVFTTLAAGPACELDVSLSPPDTPWVQQVGFSAVSADVAPYRSTLHVSLAANVNEADRSVTLQVFNRHNQSERLEFVFTQRKSTAIVGPR